ncbi:chondrolectin [Astyanax mexicanus]|uniref:chondrolectin n=1 Tax=Astyanax mexicanus TaxID=7994 RepID=UPI0020CB4908|nr:chondrolectin [Astyanax mexicanus]
MDFMKLIGAVLALCFPPGCALKGGFASQRICRRGTERPCYKIFHHHDSRFKVSFEEARKTCREEDDGELLSIETENEQRLIENFIQGLRAADGDFWIGLRRSRGSGTGDCSAQYYWLDYSQTTFRNWRWSEPSCGNEHCVSLNHKPTNQPSLKALYTFKWSDTHCNIKNNFICKYSEKALLPTPAGNSTALTVAPKIIQSVTLDYEKIKTGFSESSVSLSDDTINVYYILLATLPVLLLLILVVSGVFCYRVMSKKRKGEQNDIYAVPGQWVSAGALKNCSNSSRAPAHRANQPVAHLEYMSSEISRTFIVRGPSGPSDHYENVPGSSAGFVTNDIYETCRSPAAGEAGWVDNDIYGY